jgi:serpin B
MKFITRILAVGGLALAAGTGAASDQEKLVAANTAFAFDLTRQVAQAAPDANLFLSPYSVSSALQMVANGAAGQTRAEMQKALKTDGLPAGSLNAAFRDLNRQFAGRAAVTLDLANALWFQQDRGLSLQPAFVDDNRKFFQAEVSGVDFGISETAETINAWADKQTHGKITQIVRFPFPDRTRLILANAIYFKGKWVTPFKPRATRPREFYLPGGQTKQTPMMAQDGRFAYQENDGFQAVKLPYQGGLQMELYLPRTNASPVKLLADLSSRDKGLEGRSQAFVQREGTVVLPKFKTESTLRLNQPLQALGIRDAFTDDADFSGITTDEKLLISTVLQKTFVKVDEQGTEAAAVTTITMVGSALMRPPDNRFTMVLDHPFLFMISDADTGSILFLGMMNDPEAGD